MVVISGDVPQDRQLVHRPLQGRVQLQVRTGAHFINLRFTRNSFQKDFNFHKPTLRPFLLHLFYARSGAQYKDWVCQLIQGLLSKSLFLAIFGVKNGVFIQNQC
jgi:hypothetical protein